MIDVKFIKGATKPYLCYDFDNNHWHLNLPMDYFDDETKLNDIVQRAVEEVAKAK